MAAKHLLNVLLLIILCIPAIYSVHSVQPALTADTVSVNTAVESPINKVHGILSMENPEEWMEFNVSRGVYLLSFELRDLKYDYCYVYFYIYQWVHVYSPVLGKYIYRWKVYDQDVLTVKEGGISYREMYLYVRDSGRIAVLLTGYSITSVEYNVTLTKVLSYEDLSILAISKESGSLEGTRFFGYRVEERGLFNMSLEQTTYEVPVKYRYMYFGLVIVGMDEYESVKVYCNDTYVGIVEKNSYDLDKVADPKPGKYVIRFKYNGITGSDGLSILHIYVYYLIDGYTELNAFSKYINIDLNSSTDEVEIEISLPKKNITTRTDYILFDPTTGEKTEFTLEGNSSTSDLIYLSESQYLLINKYVSHANLSYTISLEYVKAHEVHVDTPVTVTLNSPSETVPIFIYLEEGHYYDLNITNSIETNWSVTLEDFYGNTIASMDCYYNTTKKSMRITLIPWEKNNESGPLTASSEYNYKAVGTLISYENGELTALSIWEATYKYPFIMAFISGYNYSFGAASIDIWLKDAGEIKNIGINESQEVEFSGTKIYEIFYTNVSVGMEYLVNVSPINIDKTGGIYAEMYLPSDKWLTPYSPYSRSKRFEAENSTPLILEFFTNTPGRAVIYVKVATFRGKISVSLIQNEPIKNNHIVWMGEYGDKLKIIELNAEAGRVYSISIKSNEVLILAGTALSENGSYPLSIIYDEYSYLIREWPYFYLAYMSTANSTLELTFTHSGKVFLAFIITYGSPQIIINIKDTTPYTLNIGIWLPVGIAIGIASTLIAMKIITIKKSKK